jgi:hypothetical protein
MSARGGLRTDGFQAIFPAMIAHAPARRVTAELIRHGRHFALLAVGVLLPSVSLAENALRLPSVQALKTGRLGYLASKTTLKSPAECKRRISALRIQARSAYSHRSGVRSGLYRGRLVISGPEDSVIYFVEFGCSGAILQRTHSILIADGPAPPPIIRVPPLSPPPPAEGGKQ